MRAQTASGERHRSGEKVINSHSEAVKESWGEGLGTLKLGGGVSGLQCSGRRRSSRSEVWEGKVEKGSGSSGSLALPVAGVKAET